MRKTNRHHKASLKSAAKSSQASAEEEIALNVAKATAYLNATREQFIDNVARAKQTLKEPEHGVLAGPLARRH
jgi:hypothetical protein